MKRSLSAWVTIGCLALGCGADDGSADDGDLDADAEAGPLPLPDEYAGAGTIDLLRGPYLQNVKDDSITVMWEAVEPCRGVVEYRSGALYGFTEPDASAARHEVVLTALPEHAAAIAYRIRCLSAEAVDPRATPAAAFVGASWSTPIARSSTRPTRGSWNGWSRSLRTWRSARAIA
jgi:hypothetical protein